MAAGDFFMGSKLPLSLEFFPEGYAEPAFIRAVGQGGSEVLPVPESTQTLVSLQDDPPIACILIGGNSAYRSLILQSMGLIHSSRPLRVATAPKVAQVVIPDDPELDAQD